MIESPTEKKEKELETIDENLNSNGSLMILKRFDLYRLQVESSVNLKTAEPFSEAIDLLSRSANFQSKKICSVIFHYLMFYWITSSEIQKGSNLI